MIAVDSQSQPKLSDLQDLIEQIPKYPISVHRLIELANRKRAKKAVINFYSEFPDDQLFNDEDDIVARTEQVEILQHENPPEEFFRGFED
jgi:phosphomannomutase